MKQNKGYDKQDKEPSPVFMITAGFIAAALICYSFYRDKMITGTIDIYNAENEAAVQDQAE